LFSVADRVVVVTGALGQLGAQYTRALHDAGARVVALDVDAKTRGLPAALQGLAQDRLMVLDADVTNKPTLERALEQVVARWSAPYGLVNNAGIDSPPDAAPEENGPFEAYPEESFDRVMAVNAKGVVLCCQVFGGAMAAAGRGSIVNIGSIYGSLSPVQSLYDYRRNDGQPFFKPVAYSVSKSSVLNLSRYLATYWARQGVRVNTLTLAGVERQQDERFLAGYAERMPLGRMAREDEYNGAVVFLLSDASSYMTGTNLVLDGGWSAW
jgi:NAD(P)-dependent dehydrogenase (short-subunit alcohol dehydrogenase family)